MERSRRSITTKGRMRPCMAYSESWPRVPYHELKLTAIRAGTQQIAPSVSTYWLICAFRLGAKVSHGIHAARWTYGNESSAFVGTAIISWYNSLFRHCRSKSHKTRMTGHKTEAVDCIDLIFCTMSTEGQFWLAGVLKLPAVCRAVPLLRLRFSALAAVQKECKKLAATEADEKNAIARW